MSFRGTYGTCFTTTLGSVLHELCHTFDLGHTHEGIMDRGFDNLHNFFMVVNNTSPNIELNPSNCFRSNLSNNIVLNSNGTIIRNPTCVQTNSLRRKFEDDTYFTISCSVILYYHKYINFHKT